ncbi:minor tail protein [Arthrobacter phage Richie]|uniref:Minor tail protein n=1 Tax=Arthrobacter phage Richie TaxID=2419967 RepID=A0A3G2KIN9_9CAUD|nr:minor tail protein [Arthrobacter phage Richie]AYN58848.1 minor tail protein [Arthrobacter phage Richie]
MPALKNTMEAIPDGGTRRYFGTAYYDGSHWYANVGGNLIEALWAKPITLAQNGPIVVDITNNGNGQSSALVVCATTDQPLPGTGSILTVGVTSVVVSGDDGRVYTTDRFVGTAYAPGDPVLLLWDAADIPTVVGEIPTVAPPPPPMPPPAPPAPPKPTFGTAKAAAGKTNTWWGPGGWGSWAGSTGGGEQIYSGSYGAGATSGAWFYGAAFTNLGSRSITEIRFRMPSRLNVGASGSATVHLYAHTSKYQPGGDVARTVGPFDVTVSQAQGAHWIKLPLSFAAVLKAGGGISIAGEPYVGFNGRLKDPQSGRIEMDWTD